MSKDFYANRREYNALNGLLTRQAWPTGKTPSGWYFTHGRYASASVRRKWPRAGVWWTNAERWAMLAALSLGKPMRWVAKRHGRSVSGMDLELQKLTFDGLFPRSCALELYRMMKRADCVARSPEAARVLLQELKGAKL